MSRPHNITDFGPSDLLTSPIEGVRRVAVDQQQTSFEQNIQFRFFDRIDGVSSSDQVVYRFETTDPINVFFRTIGGWGGGREYLVYPDSPTINITGQPQDVGAISQINQNLRPEIDAHPVSGVSVQRIDGNNVFSSGPDDAPVTGSFFMSGRSASATSIYSPSNIRFGIGSSRVFWLVLEHIGQNDDSSAHFELVWEERFGE